jgi:2-haloacid dehalogenase
MPAVSSMRLPTSTLAFDFYGTVVDMQSGLTRAIAPYLAEKGSALEPGRVVTWWRRTHFENSMIDALLRGEHTPYRQVGFIALDATLERAGIPHSDPEVEALVAAIERLEPFPDAARALASLRAKGYRLAVLSNGDPDMLERGVAHAGIPFDAVLSVAAAGSFKPDRVTYETAARALGTPPAEILFVANHVFDCVGAKAAGMRTAFVDRRRRPFGRWPQQPDLVVPDLAALAAALEPRPPGRSD